MEPQEWQEGEQRDRRVVGAKMAFALSPTLETSQVSEGKWGYGK